VSTTPAPKKRKKRTDKLLGQLLAGKYEILKKIGEGGMGSVYIATQQSIDRKVAIKVLLGKLAEDTTAVARFEQEAKAISKMQHPNTVTIYDFGRTEGTDEDEDERLYIVMEYLKGRTLTQLLRAHKVLPAPRACKIIRQVCASLADAHATGIIHRDLKPDNIFLTEVGGDPDWVKVLDFGVAKLADSESAGNLTQTGMIFGTPKYMSPEQAEGRPIDYRADIYALGVVLYELLVGRPPFIADTPVGLLLKHISEPPAPFSKVRPDLQIDPRIEAITMRALDKRPDARQQMVSELAAELEAFERIASGPMMAVQSGTYPTPAQGGLPTEVVPGTLPGASPLTPSNLQPPGAVPSSLSLGGVSGGTEAVGPNHQAPSGATAAAQAHSAAYHPADALPTAAQGAMPAASVQMTAHGLTHPVGAVGGGVETLGGIGGEISGPFPGRTEKKKRSPMLFVGLGLLAGAAALAAFVATKSGDRGGITVAPVATTPQAPKPASKTPKPTEPKVAGLAAPERTAPPSDTPEQPPPSRPSTPRTNRPTRTAPPPPAAPEPVKKTKISVRFESEPTASLVMMAGKQLGITPFTREFPLDGDVLSFVFTKDGFEKMTRTVVTNRDHELSVSLDKAPEPVVVKKPKPTTTKKPTTKRPTKKPKPTPTKTPSDKVESDPLQERVGDLKAF